MRHKGFEPNLQIRVFEQNKKTLKIERLHICYSKMAGDVGLVRYWASWLFLVSSAKLITEKPNEKYRYDKKHWVCHSYSQNYRAYDYDGGCC